MDLDHSMLETQLRSSKVTKNGITTAIFDCPKLLYASDGEEDDNLQDENRQYEVQGPGLVLALPFQSLEQVDPQFEQSADKVRSIMALSEGNPLLKEVVDDVDLLEALSNVKYWIEYLVKKCPAILAVAKLENPAQTSRILRKLGSEIQVLRPGNSADGDLGDWRDKSQWRRQLSALVSELMMVEVGCSPEVRDSEGVFVLTTFDYPALLEMMAREILQTFGVA